jgi:hypothetical protein
LDHSEQKESKAYYFVNGPFIWMSEAACRGRSTAMLTVTILGALAGMGLSQRFGALSLLPATLLAIVGILVFATTFHLPASAIFAAVPVAILSVNVGYFFGVFHQALIRSLLRRRQTLRRSWSHR